MKKTHKKNDCARLFFSAKHLFCFLFMTILISAEVQAQDNVISCTNCITHYDARWVRGAGTNGERKIVAREDWVDGGPPEQNWTVNKNARIRDLSFYPAPVILRPLPTSFPPAELPLIFKNRGENRNIVYNIYSIGHTVIKIKGTGQYLHDSRIAGFENRGLSLTLSAPSAGNWGGQYAGIILRGENGWRMEEVERGVDYSGIFGLNKHRYWIWRDVQENTGANNYHGATTIHGGYIACAKPRNVTAIPGDIIMKTSAGGAESSLWF